jgi:hypothetical protein
MIARIAFFLFVPVVIFIGCVLAAEALHGGSFEVVLNSFITFIYNWPIDLLATLGLIESGDEGFYNEWGNFSLATSLLLSSATLFALSLYVSKRNA